MLRSAAISCKILVLYLRKIHDASVLSILQVRGTHEKFGRLRSESRVRDPSVVGEAVGVVREAGTRGSI